MNYPLLSEYIEAIKSSEDNFDKLSNRRPGNHEDRYLIPQHDKRQ